MTNKIGNCPKDSSVTSLLSGYIKPLWMPILMLAFACASIVTTPKNAQANSIEHMGMDDTYRSAPLLNMGAHQVRSEARRLEEMGYRVADITSYRYKGGTRYSMVMAQDEDRAYRWMATPGISLPTAQRTLSYLRTSGQRPASVSVVREAGIPKATILMVYDDKMQDSVAFLDQSQYSFQRNFSHWNGLTRDGYRPTHMQVHTDGYGNPRFSSIFVRDGLTSRDWVARYGWDQARLEQELAHWERSNFRPISIASYTVDGRVLYGVVGIRNRRGTPWRVVLDQGYSQFQATHRSLDSGWKLFAMTSLGSTTSRHSGIFVGPSPIQGVVSRGNWNLNSPNLAILDSQLRNRMRASSASAASVSITYRGKLVFARAYTNAPVGFPTTTPTSQFRVASVSKAFTGAGVLALRDHQLLELDDDLSESVTLRCIEKDTWDLSIENLLRHESNIGRSALTNSAVRDWRYKNGLSVPRYLQTRHHSEAALCKDTTGTYSNQGYLLLSLAMEAVSGRSYEDLMIDTVFAPLGMNDTVPARSARIKRAGNEVSYQLDLTKKVTRAQDSDSARYVSQFYGGDLNFENFTAAGGWVSTSVDMARFASRITDHRDSLLSDAGLLSFTEVNPATASYRAAGVRLRRASGGVSIIQSGSSMPWRTGGFAKSGELDGTLSWIETSGDWSYAYVLNANDATTNSAIRSDILSALNAIESRPIEQNQLHKVDYFSLY
jgi:CubicO group peptidase (beta-lactamase class C family)